jgi:hypothetical protein
LFYSANKRAEEVSKVASLVIAVSVILCAAYLLWQFYNRDLLDDG